MFVGEYKLGRTDSEDYSEDNVIQLNAEKGSSLPKTNVLKLTAFELKKYVISSGINKSDYIFLMLQLLFKGQSIEVDLCELAEFLCCGGTTALGKDKEIEITVDDIQIELAKLTKKGLLANSETVIQLRLSDVP